MMKLLCASRNMPMFHNEHRVFAALLSDGKDWRDCWRPRDRHRVDLKDRTGALFPVAADVRCRNSEFNALPQSAAEYVSWMRELGIRRFRERRPQDRAVTASPFRT
jgi:putative protease